MSDTLAPIRRLPAPQTDSGMPVRYGMPVVLGHVRLLAGMVRANRPWRALAGLSYAVVAALATGAYAVLNSTVWQLSHTQSVVRFLGEMLLALAAVVAWLIVSHRLWERADGSTPRKETALYNAATVLTLLVAVLCAYALLFAGVLLAAALAIDPQVYRSQVSHPATIASYLRLAWLGASIATVAGALGSGLQDIRRSPGSRLRT